MVDRTLKFSYYYCYCVTVLHVHVYTSCFVGVTVLPVHVLSSKKCYEASHSCRATCKHSESAQESGEQCYISDHQASVNQTVPHLYILFCLCHCPPCTCPVLSVSLSPIHTSCFVCVSIHCLYVLFSVTVDPLHLFACCGCGVRFDSSQSSEDLLIKLRRELERCVISNREKRSKVGELQQHNKHMQQDLTDLRQQLSDAQHTIHTMQVVIVNIRLIERKGVVMNIRLIERKGLLSLSVPPVVDLVFPHFIAAVGQFATQP